MTDNSQEATPETHGWLEQFGALAKESFTELEAVVTQGLQPNENEVLIQIAAKLIKLAEIHDPEALIRLTELHESMTRTDSLTDSL